ncbi:MAG: hypothetical protein AB7P49_10835, partial [Bdellovibrionales bacterium]
MSFRSRLNQVAAPCLSINLRLGLLCCAFVILSCAREYESASPPVKAHLTGQGECFSRFSERLSAYVDGRMGPQDVARFWSCIDDAVNEFRRLTIGEGPKGEYSPQAVRHFLQRYLFKDSIGVSDELLAQLMELDAATAGCEQARPACVRELPLDPKHKEILAPLPRLRRVLDQGELDFIRYVNQAEEIALSEIRDSPFSTSDLLQVWMLFQYVETFLRRYDQDVSETVALSEALRAYEIYGPTLTVLLAPTGLLEQDVLAFFT